MIVIENGYRNDNDSHLGIISISLTITSKY